MSIDDEIQAAKERTAEALGVEIEDLDYITAEFLAVEAVSDETPYEVDEHQGVAPNRITYISHVDVRPDKWAFYVNCNYTVKYWVWAADIDRWERAGSCRVPNGNYVPRYKLWWRAWTD